MELRVTVIYSCLGLREEGDLEYGTVHKIGIYVLAACHFDSLIINISLKSLWKTGCFSSIFRLNRATQDEVLWLIKTKRLDCYNVLKILYFS